MSPPGRRPDRFVLTREAGSRDRCRHRAWACACRDSDRSGELVGEIAENDGLDVDAEGVKALLKVLGLIETALGSDERAISAVRALVMGVPAALDKDGRVLFRIPAIVGARQPRRRALRADEGAVPSTTHWSGKNIRLENDANLGAIGEGCKGAAIGHQHYLYVKASTGIGMGIVARGRIYRGTEGAAGEFGHMTASPAATPFLRSAYDAPAAPCPRCSKLDCLENLASGRALLQRFWPNIGDVSDRAVDEFIASATKAPAASDDERKQAVVDAATRIGYTLGDVIRLLAPEVVVIGGLLATTGELLGKPIKDAITGTQGHSAREGREARRKRSVYAEPSSMVRSHGQPGAGSPPSAKPLGKPHHHGQPVKFAHMALTGLEVA